MMILLAVLALVVVKALAESPWGVFTVGATIPIAMFMGGYMRFGAWAGAGGSRRSGWWGCCWRCGAASWSMRMRGWRTRSGWRGEHAGLGDHRVRAGGERAAGVAAAGAARLPQHVHEAGHDLRCWRWRSCWSLPDLQMPAVTQVRRWLGPGRGRARCFRSVFITIACGAISGFHTLIASGTTPKMMTREW